MYTPSNSGLACLEQALEILIICRALAEWINCVVVLHEVT